MYEVDTTDDDNVSWLLHGVIFQMIMLLKYPIEYFGRAFLMITQHSFWQFIITIAMLSELSIKNLLTYDK